MTEQGKPYMVGLPTYSRGVVERVRQALAPRLSGTMPPRGVAVYTALCEWLDDNEQAEQDTPVVQVGQGEYTRKWPNDE